MIGRLFFLTLIRRHGIIIKNVQKILENFCSFSREFRNGVRRDEKIFFDVIGIVRVFIVLPDSVRGSGIASGGISRRSCAGTAKGVD
jgi:hypothetical protein